MQIRPAWKTAGSFPIESGCALFPALCASSPDCFRWWLLKIRFPAPPNSLYRLRTRSSFIDCTAEMRLQTERTSFRLHSLGIRRESIWKDGFCQSEEADVHSVRCLRRGVRRGSLAGNGWELLCPPASLVLCRSPPEGCVGCPASGNCRGPAWCGNYRSSVTFMWLYSQCLPRGSSATGLYSFSNALWEEAALQFLTQENQNQSQDQVPFPRAPHWTLSWLPVLGTAGGCSSLHLPLPPPCLPRICPGSLLPRRRARKVLPALCCLSLPCLQSCWNSFASKFSFGWKSGHRK